MESRLRRPAVTPEKTFPLRQGMVSSDPVARNRKRERDRENQRQKRLRERDTVEELTRKNASLEQQLMLLHDGSGKAIQELSETVKLLKEKNEVLTKRVKMVDKFIETWSEECEGGVLVGAAVSSEEPRNDIDTGLDVSSRTTPTEAAGEGLLFITGQECSAVVKGQRIAVAGEPFQVPQGQPLLTPSHSQAGLLELKVPPGNIYQMMKLPVWKRMPLYLDIPEWNPFGSVIHQMRNSLEKFALCAAEPEISGLLFGNSTNELANSTFQFTSRIPSRGTEKCAINWACYMLNRWIVKPTEDNYSRIPKIFRPTLRQWFLPHPPVFDYVIWPEVRDNFIHYGMKYCRQEVFDLLFSSCRIRDPPDFLVYRDGASQLDPEYLETISSVEGWILKETFWTEYPELVQGLDPQIFMVLD